MPQGRNIVQQRQSKRERTAFIEVGRHDIDEEEHNRPFQVKLLREKAKT
jgi:hypothetical protein